MKKLTFSQERILCVINRWSERGFATLVDLQREASSWRKTVAKLIEMGLVTTTSGYKYHLTDAAKPIVAALLAPR